MNRDHDGVPLFWREPSYLPDALSKLTQGLRKEQTPILTQVEAVFRTYCQPSVTDKSPITEALEAVLDSSDTTKHLSLPFVLVQRRYWYLQKMLQLEQGLAAEIRAKYEIRRKELWNNFFIFDAGSNGAEGRPGGWRVRPFRRPYCTCAKCGVDGKKGSDPLLISDEDVFIARKTEAAGRPLRTWKRECVEAILPVKMEKGENGETVLRLICEEDRWLPE